MSVATDANTGELRVDTIINDYLSVRLESWRNINVYDEIALLFKKNSVKNKARFTFGNWNINHDPVIERNGENIEEGPDFNVDRTTGILSLAEEWLMGEEIRAALYNFDYFPNADLYNLVRNSLFVLNSSGIPQTNYTTLASTPAAWDGPITEITYMEALRKIRLDSTIWRSYVLLRVEPTDALSAISEEINASESRLQSLIEGSKHLKHISTPTMAYYLSVTGGIFGRSGWGIAGMGADGVPGGRLRGFRSNRGY